MSEFTALVMPGAAAAPVGHTPGPFKIAVGKSYRDRGGDVIVDPEVDDVGYWFLTNKRTGERERFFPNGEHWGAPGSARDIVAEFTPAPPHAGRTPGLIRPAHTSDAGRDLVCRLYSAETGVLIANTETGQLPRGDDVANAAFIRLAWNSHDRLVSGAIDDRAALQIAFDHLPSDTPADVVAALKERVAKADELLAEIEGSAS